MKPPSQGFVNKYSQPSAWNLPLLSNQDVLDLQCLSSVEKIGDPPDGCDPGRYARLGWIQKTDRFWTLTTEGRERLADLRAEERDASRVMGLHERGHCDAGTGFQRQSKG